jgi:hypothetical protein
MPGKVDYAALLAGFGSSEYRELRPAQSAMLSRYATDFTTSKDVAVELPTGAGNAQVVIPTLEDYERKVLLISEPQNFSVAQG